MKKTLAALLSATLVIALALAPSTALAKKKKKISESFSASGLPYPVSGSSNNGYGCAEGIEGVHRTSVELHTPGKGILDVTIQAFEGDWDLHVLGPDNEILGQSTSGNLGGTERVIVPLGKNLHVTITACNWSGGPTAEGAYTFTY